MTTTAYNRSIQLLNECRLIVPYQHTGVKWMLHRELEVSSPGGILADEVGLGKTIQTIATILGNPLPHTLMVMPISIIPQWISQIQRFAPQLNVFWLDSNTKKNPTCDYIVRNFDITITSFGHLLPLTNGAVNPLYTLSWDRMIIDEAHFLRNPKAKRRMALDNLAISGPRWALTATPIHNRMSDFKSLITFIDKKLAHVDIEEVKGTIMLRRTKKQVEGYCERLALPPLEEKYEEVVLSNNESEMYKKVFAESQKEMAKELQRQHKNYATILVLILRCIQCCIHPQLYLSGVKSEESWDTPSSKFQRLRDLLRERKTKSLVFCKFRLEMKILRKYLETNGFQVCQLDGSLSMDDREDSVQEFKISRHPMVFLIQINCGGCGLNLQEAQDVYFTSPHWNPAMEEQGMGRAHRTGQTSVVRVTKLVSLLQMGTLEEDENRTIDNSIVERQIAKMEMMAKVVDVDGELTKKISKLTVRDIRKMFNL